MTPVRVLAFVIVVFVGLSTLVAAWTAPWEANDEPDHVQNVVTLVRGEWYRIEPGAGLEPHQPPLYYMGMSVWFRAFGLEPTIPSPPSSPGIFLGGPAFEHEYAGAAADKRRVRALRLPSIALGVATILLTFACARRLSNDPWTPVVAAAIVAGVPRFVFLSGSINNDNLVNALGALLALLAVYWVMEPPRTPRARLLAAGALGLVLGALVLTKISTVPLAVGVALAVFFLARKLPERALLLTVAATAALLVCGWWLWRNYSWYGDPFTIETTTEYLRAPIAVPGGDEAILTRVFSSIPEQFYESFFYTSGWNQFTWSFWGHFPYWLLTACALASLAVRGRVARLSPELRRAAAVLTMLLLGALASVWLIGTMAVASGAQGRLAFSGLAALGCLAALGLERLPIPVMARFALPVLGLAGTLFALRQDVWLVYMR